MRPSLAATSSSTSGSPPPPPGAAAARTTAATSSLARPLEHGAQVMACTAALTTALSAVPAPGAPPVATTLAPSPTDIAAAAAKGMETEPLSSAAAGERDKAST
eukprot:4006014-Pyramimonas_sp.AAC.1